MNTAEKIINPIDGEIYPIPRFDDYGVTTDGRVFTRKFGRPWREMALHLKGKKGSRQGDYYKIKLYRDGTCYQVGVHILIARTFHGEKPTPMHVVDHIDTNKRNNHYTNLEYVTYSENTKRAIATGVMPQPYIAPARSEAMYA
jgi:hypothetical protein